VWSLRKAHREKFRNIKFDSYGRQATGPPLSTPTVWELGLPSSCDSGCCWKFVNKIEMEISILSCHSFSYKEERS
jgi:hypothetical protein